MKKIDWNKLKEQYSILPWLVEPLCPHGSVSSPDDLRKQKLTTAEYGTIMSLFRDKTTFYIKSGSIYKPVNTGRGDYMIAFKLNGYRTAQLKSHESNPFELVYPNGTLKIDKILYGGINIFQKK